MEKPTKPDRPIASPSEPEYAEGFVPADAWLEVAEYDGMRGVYAYWTDYDGPEGEPVAIATQLVDWFTDDNGKEWYTPDSGNIEGYDEDRSYVKEDGIWRTVMPVSAFMRIDGSYTWMATYIMDAEKVPASGGFSDLPGDAWDINGERFPFEVPPERVSAPTNVSVDASGRISWDTVDDVVWYNIRLYEKGTEGQRRNTLVYGADGQERISLIPFPNILKAGKQYKYAIEAVSYDSLTYQNSEAVETAYFELGKQNAVIDDMLGLQGDELAQAVENKKLTADELDKMRTDIISSEAIESSYRELERTYLGATGKQATAPVTADGAVDVSKVDILGGALNQIEEVHFSTVKVASASEAYPELGQYKGIVCMEITPKSEAGDKTELQWPVMITMPVPEGMPASILKIRHYRSDGGVETITPRVNDDGTISFAITHFSLFAFVQDGDYDGDDANKPDDNGQGNHGGSSSSGSSSGSVRAQENGTWHQDAVGWWFVKKDGSYPKQEWYECYWNGAMNWYHFNEQGYLDAGWFTDRDGQTYYLHDQHDNRFGYMYTGWNWISGKCYYFNTAARTDGAKLGSLVRNGLTPDGYTVDADGAWTVNGAVQTH